MNRKLVSLATAVLILLITVSAWAGDMVDRIVATVNGHPILQSDWDEAVEYEAFVNGRDPASTTLDQRKAALDRLIDQELIHEQIPQTKSEHVTADDINRRIQEVRKAHPEASTSDAWNAVLQHYGLTEAELREKVASELDDMRAVDAHLRPNVQIDSRTIEAYYQNTLLPELRHSGSADVPLDQVAPKIRELLAQQKINDLLVNWIRTLRAESDIRTPSGARSGGGGL